jgi:hypothetical protein
VRQNQCLRFYHIHLSLFIQTLATLSLNNNQIGDKGAKYLGGALENKAVRQNQSLHFYHIHLSYFIQTLSTLILAGNQIGDKGAKYLGRGLQKNTV